MATKKTEFMSRNARTVKRPLYIQRQYLSITRLKKLLVKMEKTTIGRRLADTREKFLRISAAVPIAMKKQKSVMSPNPTLTK